MKKSNILVISGALILAGSSLAYACSSCGCRADAKSSGYSHVGEAVAAKSSVVQVSEVKNKVCPVMGNKINRGEAVKVVYDGKVYNLCCAGCVASFKENPEKYIQMINEELSGAASAEK